MRNLKIQALKAKQAEQSANIEALNQAEHDARIDAMTEETANYYKAHRAAHGIKTVITPWNTPFNEILNGAR